MTTVQQNDEKNGNGTKPVAANGQVATQEVAPLPQALAPEVEDHSPTIPDPIPPAHDDVAAGVPKKNDRKSSFMAWAAVIALALIGLAFTIYLGTRGPVTVVKTVAAPAVTVIANPDLSACGSVTALANDTRIDCAGRPTGQYLSSDDKLFSCGCAKPLPPVKTAGK